MGSDEAPRAARPILLLGLSLWLAGLGADTQGASPGVGMNRAHGACEAVARREEETPAPSLLLQGIHPDFGRYIRALRPLGTIDRRESEPRPIYMALVRPGAVDPVRNESAPFIGPGARNDILYDVFAIGKGRSTAWTLLLLDHEYFHARHLAGSTSLPLPSGAVPEIERHFYEAAAWGFNVAQARSGRYAGLRPDEFREALDRYGEHYAALRSLMEAGDPQGWKTYSDLLRAEARLLTTSARPSRADRARPSGSDRSPAIP